MLQPNNKVSYRSPSNIAFVKYWGKHGRQLPMNPSISMTLDHCATEMSLSFSKSKSTGLQSFKFEGVENEKFATRIRKFTESITDIIPSLNNVSFSIESKNTFPHSAGIASSASAMSALACCLIEMESIMTGDRFDKNKASLVSRLGSGSACRSIFPKYAIWGETKLGYGTNDYAIEAQDIHQDFSELKDAIVIVSSDEKEVSSSVGHELMNTHLFKEVREFQAHENMRQIMSAMKNGDFESFGDVLENEALTLHAMMMTSYPSFILLRPNSIAVIESVKQFRKETGLPLYFTIDAGPNIHLIYPKSIELKVESFISESLSALSEKIIFDRIGDGASKLND